MAGEGQWIKSQMGTTQLKDADGFHYGFFRELKNSNKYRCTKKRTPEYKCPATAFVKRDTNPPIIYEVQLINFMAYIMRTWIGRGTGPQRKKPMFPIQSWNKHEDVIMDKLLTNNVVETYNANWTDTMERTSSLYSDIEGFIRQVC